MDTTCLWPTDTKAIELQVRPRSSYKDNQSASIPRKKNVIMAPSFNKKHSAEQNSWGPFRPADKEPVPVKRPRIIPVNSNKKAKGQSLFSLWWIM
jgi:hypothetical protein